MGLFTDMDEAGQLAGGSVLPDPLTDFKVRQEQLARRRKLAESLVAQAMDTKGQMVSGIYVAKNPWQNFVEGAAGSGMGAYSDAEQNNLARQEQQAAQTLIKRLGTPGMKEQMGPAPEGQTMPQGPLSPEEEDARRIGILGEGMAIPSLRKTIEAQLGQELDYPRQREQEKVKSAAETARLAAQDERQAKLFAQQQELLDKRLAGQKDLRGMPTIVIHQGNGGKAKPPMGYEWNGDELQPIKGGPKDPNSKPVNLTAAQQKAVDDSDSLLGHIDNALEMVKTNPGAIGFKTVIPDMALSKIDPEGVAARAAVGGLSAERVHQLSGAAVSPAEFARLRPYLPASGDTADAVEKKLTNLRAEVERIRTSHMKGPTRAQPQQPGKPTVVRTGILNGRKVEQLSDGTTRYAD